MRAIIIIQKIINLMVFKMRNQKLIPTLIKMVFKNFIEMYQINDKGYLISEDGQFIYDQDGNKIHFDQENIDSLK